MAQIKSKFNIPSDPVADRIKAQDSIRTEIQEGDVVKPGDECSDESLDEVEARLSGKPKAKTETPANPVKGQILVGGARMGVIDGAISVFLDADVRVLLEEVVHSSANKQLTYNELLRMSLIEIRSGKHGELLIKTMIKNKSH